MRAGEGGERDSCAGAGPVLRLHSAVDASAASVHAASRSMNAASGATVGQTATAMAVATTAPSMTPS